MNALANDQLERLTMMLKDFTNDEITFGRYTGETPWTEKDAKEKYPDHESIPCERFTREEIRENPPHILLTNFAMLEYLLIRPRDVEIFRHQRLKYIVLDEAHTYRGAQGIEVGLLMRRLSETFQNSNFQFFLTSATFTSGDSKNVRKDLANFASNLTGSVFEVDDILFGNIEDPFPEESKDNYIKKEKLLKCLPNEEALKIWFEAVSNPEDLRDLLLKSGFIKKGSFEAFDSTHLILYELLRDNSLLKRIYQRTKDNPVSVPEIAIAIWGEDNELYRRTVQWLLVMGSRAKASPDSGPLLGSKIHIFFRGLNGASVCLSPNCPAKKENAGTKWSFFTLKSIRNCPHCDGRAFPLEVCWHCGLPVISIYISNNNWTSFIPPYVIEPKKRFLTWWDGLEMEDSDSSSSDDNDPPSRYAHLCPCGYYSENSDENCRCGKKLLRLRIVEDREGKLEKCPKCGGEPGFFDDVTRSFITADDAPTAVLADSIMRSLPKEEGSDDRPANGRRLLAFSDSRQRAAYFAPYLMRTTCESAYQQPLMAAILQATEEDRVSDFSEVSNRYVSIAKSQPYVVTWENTGQDNETYQITPTRRAGRSVIRQLRRNCLISLYRQFCSSMRQRNKLVGLGLCSVFIELLQDEIDIFNDKLPELSIEYNGHLPAIQLLLNIFLSRKAVSFLDQIQGQEISNIVIDVSFHRDQSNPALSNKIYRWNPYLAPVRSRRIAVDRSRQLKLLCKITGLEPEKDKEELSGLLNRIWDCLFDKEYPDHSIIVDCQNGRRKLNGHKLLLEIPEKWFRCEICGYLVPPSMNFKDLCPSPECNGKLKTIEHSDLERTFLNNHERHRYKTPPMPLEVKEHTAQLQLRSSKKYQDDFKKGYVNVLSCSTTFEMGVDIGSLKVAMLRNIPPSSANYIQRAGRVGRRKEGVSYVVSYSRKLPHDQYFFSDPERIISGKVNIPYLSLKNDVLAQRHANSFLLGAYLKDDSNNRFGDRIFVKDFFLEPTSENSSASMFPQWAKNNSTIAIDSLSRIIPKESTLSPEKAFDNALNSLFSDNEACIFRRYVLSTIQDYDQQIEELKEEAEKAGENHRLKAIVYNCIKDIENYKKKFLGQRLIDFLSSKAWLPNYAFPQDSIELRVLQPDFRLKMNLTRDRDIGIAEYAPGAEIIADGKVFKSKGVLGRKISPEESIFEPKKYLTCSECRILKQFPIYASNIPRNCDCGRPYSRPRIYIILEGFSTSIKDPVENPRFRRIPPSPNSEVFLVEGATIDEFRDHPEIPGLTYALKRGGKLFRANMGFRRHQFRVCMKCGKVIDRGNGRNHETLWGNKCSGGASKLKSVDLAHEFQTDVLEIRFLGSSVPTPPITDRTFWISFLYSFLNGTSRRLDIDHNDLAGIYHRVPETTLEAEIVIYDCIPGGAGYLNRIIDSLKECFHSALDVVQNCKDPACNDLESSCYACLRSYKNQFDWENLRRKPVIDWLSNFV